MVEVEVVPAQPGIFYSLAWKVGPFVFLAGHQGEYPETGERPKDLEKEIEQAYENLNRSIKAAGTSWSNVVKTTYYLRDQNTYETLKKVRPKVFKKYNITKYPASTAVFCQLIGGARIEIEAIAIIPERSY